MRSTAARRRRRLGNPAPRLRRRLRAGECVRRSSRGRRSERRRRLRGLREIVIEDEAFGREQVGRRRVLELGSLLGHPLAVVHDDRGLVVERLRRLRRCSMRARRHVDDPRDGREREHPSRISLRLRWRVRPRRCARARRGQRRDDGFGPPVRRDRSGAHDRLCASAATSEQPGEEAHRASKRSDVRSLTKTIAAPRRCTRRTERRMAQSCIDILAGGRVAS
jgi:hypothetical protein